MQVDHVERLKYWFDAYTRDFLSGDAEADSPLILKIEHTARVCDNIRHLSRNIGLDQNARRVAEVIALFHDLGRFEQYRRYQTFDDRRSLNHALKGLAVLADARLLDPLPGDESKIIRDAIRFHNASAIPQGHASDSTLFMRLIRDADKLDIWHVFAGYYTRSTPQNPAVVQHLADQPTWEPKIVDAIQDRRPARFADMKSLNDFKLLQLSWVFGLHFETSAILARERGDLKTIARTLPFDKPVQTAVSTVMTQLEAAVDRCRT